VLLPDRVRPVYISAALWQGMWTVGLSLATAVLGGLLLNLLPAGLTRATWTIGLAGTALLAIATAAMLRVRASPAAPAGSAVTTSGTPARPASAGARTLRRLHGPATVYSAAAVVAVAAAIWLGVFSAAREHPAGFAQLWMVPAGTGTGRATVGVRNDYPRTQRFHLVLQRGSQAVAEWNIELPAGKAWTTAVDAPAGQRLSAELTAPGERRSSQAVTLNQGASAPAPSPGTSGHPHADRGRR
jgi:hypothetical protein